MRIKTLFQTPSNKIIQRLKLKILIKYARFFSDKFFLQALFPIKTGYPLNLKNPKTYNEKLQWLKLYDRNTNYVRMVDKAEAKKYVSDIIGEEYIIPTLGLWDRVEDIEWDKLPNQFVLKCTHDSGGIVICKDKKTLDRDAAIKKLSHGLNVNYFYQNREWPYKKVKPRIIAEVYMEDAKQQELRDYKWFCFNGEPKAMFIASDRFTPGEETKFDFYDTEFNHLPFINGHPNSTQIIEKPEGFDKMKELAAKLSKDIPHVRADFYVVNGRIYFGELTFYHWSGMVPFQPQEWDYIFGDYIKLDLSK